MFIPNWKADEKNLSSDDPQIAEQAGDSFIKTRENELKKSQKARSWEKGRKKEWEKAKPDYIKRRNAIDRDPSKKTIEKLLDGGSFETSVIPSPGMILLELDSVNKKLNGIYLPESKDDSPNTGRVVEVGSSLVLENGAVIKFPFGLGDRVIIRKFSANMHVNIAGKKYYFLQFNDVLGKLKDE